MDIMSIKDTSKRLNTYNIYLERVYPLKRRYLQSIDKGEKQELLTRIRDLEAEYNIPIKFSLLQE